MSAQVTESSFSVAAGPHPRRGLTLIPRSGFAGPHSVWPQALLFALRSIRIPSRVNPQSAIRSPQSDVPAGKRREPQRRSDDTDADEHRDVDAVQSPAGDRRVRLEVMKR